MSELKVKWVDRGREPKCAPNPEYPEGIDIDASGGEKLTCEVSLPYPAKRCGYFLVTCNKCYQSILVTTAGRPDDPRHLKVACKVGVH